MVMETTSSKRKSRPKRLINFKSAKCKKCLDILSPDHSYERTCTATSDGLTSTTENTHENNYKSSSYSTADLNVEHSYSCINKERSEMSNSPCPNRKCRCVIESLITRIEQLESELSKAENFGQ